MSNRYDPRVVQAAKTLADREAALKAKRPSQASKEVVKRQTKQMMEALHRPVFN